MSREQLEPIMALLSARTSDLTGDLENVRREFVMLATSLPAAPNVSRQDVQCGAMKAAWFEAPQTADRTILYLHGGGYALGSIDTHQALVSHIATATKARCFVPDYRLAPEHPHPAAVEDATTAYRWLLDQGTDPARLAVMGDSAGGGLTLATLVKLRDEGAPLPAAAVCISPWVDLEATGESMATKAAEDPMIQRDQILTYARFFNEGGNMRDPLAAPLYADLQGLPPILIHVGSAETLLDDSTRIHQRLVDAGVNADLEVWDGMIHVWHAFAGLLDEGKEAIDNIGRFVEKHVP